MAFVVGRYEALFTLICPYNKGHKCIVFIETKYIYINVAMTFFFISLADSTFSNSVQLKRKTQSPCLIKDYRNAELTRSLCVYVDGRRNNMDMTDRTRSVFTRPSWIVIIEMFIHNEYYTWLYLQSFILCHHNSWILCLYQNKICYPLANEVARGYSNATVRLSITILVNTLGSTSFNGFWPNLVHI